MKTVSANAEIEFSKVTQIPRPGQIKKVQLNGRPEYIRVRSVEVKKKYDNFGVYFLATIEFGDLW